MLKLRKCHLAAIGNRNARFSPVNLDFTGDAGAVNSVVFLENGGGKTTLAAFLYLTLWPEQNHFLLKKAKDSQVRVADYLMPGQTAYCVLECETRIAGVSEQPIIRIIGQVLQRRDATDRSPVQRHFFTFLPCEGLNFDDLPIHGINSRQTSLSIDDFRAWLREQRAKFPAAELWEGSSNEEYLQKLRDTHAEPELVRVQVDLNKREGGIDDHFKEHCADSRRFVHTFLDLALQSAKADETVAVLQTFLSEWLNIGHLEDETLFCEEFASSLGSLSDAQTRWTKAHETLEHCRNHAAALWSALERKREEMQKRCEEADSLLATARTRALDAKREVDNSNHHFISYELEWLELRANEASVAAENAEREWQAARRTNHLAKLAVALGEVERQRRDLEAKRKVLQEKQAELAPLLDKLNAWGAALVICLSVESSDVAADLELVVTNLKIRKERQQQLEQSQRQLAVDRRDCERTLADTKSFADRRRYQRDQLGDQGWLESNERAEDGHTRWVGERDKEKANVVERRAHLLQLDQRLRELNSERTRVEGESARAEFDVDSARSSLTVAARQRQTIETNDFVLAHFGEGFDPLRHGAKEAFMRKQADVFQVLLTLQLDYALLLRNRQGIEKYQVLPPARDVELVLERLSEVGIEAVAGLRYLAETSNCEEAEHLIRHEPGKYAGVLIHAKHWPKVSTLAWPEVTQPVEVSLLPDSVGNHNGFSSHVVVPSRPAFDKAEASRRSLGLEDELNNSKRQLDDKRAEYDGVGQVTTLLSNFIDQYGEGRLGVLERELREKLRHAEGLRSRAVELTNEIGVVERERTTTREAELSSSERLNSRIQPAISRIQGFITEFEQKTDEMRRLEQVSRDRLFEIETEERSLETQRNECEVVLAQLQVDLFQLQFRHKQLGDEVAGIAYRKGSPDHELSTQSVDTLRAGYNQQRQLYEGQQDSAAQIEIATAEGLLRSKQRDLSQQLESATETEVRAVAEPLGYVETKLREEAARAAQALERAVLARADRNAARDGSKKQYNERQQTAPEGGKRRFPEGELRPELSVEAFALMKKGQARHDENVARKQALDDEVRTLGDLSGELQKKAAEYESQRNLLDAFRNETAPAIDIPAEFSEVRAAVSSARAQEKNAAADEQREHRERSVKLRAARAITADARFTDKKLGLAKRFESYTDEALLSDVDQVRSDLEQRIAVNRDRLAGLKQTREQLIHMMDGLADEILSLLRSIEKVSRLPDDGMGAWSGKPFIRLSFHQPDASERQIALRQLLEELIELRRSKPNQLPDTDTAGLLQLIADRTVCDKRIQVQILKPTPTRTDSYENVELLRHYSGGEGVTVAILIYLTIVQLRAQNLQNSRRLQDAGFLLLDNPFGKCNRADLVQMQVQLAEQLRVQLIVLTGLREPVIMMSYPRRIRLVNDLLNRVTGAKHVRIVESEGTVTAVDNLRRFTLART